MSIPLLERIAAGWEREGVVYSVVSGLERYPEQLGRDLDVLVRRDQLARAASIAEQVLVQEGLSVVHPPPLWGTRLVAVDTQRPTSMLEIHFITEVVWRTVVLARNPEPNGKIGLFSIDPFAIFVKRIVASILNGDAEKLGRSLHSAAVLPSERTAEQLRMLAGAVLAAELVDNVRAGDGEALLSMRAKLAAAFLRRAWLRTPLTSCAQLLRAISRKFRQPFYPCAPTLALVGPDGAGKSSLIRALSAGDPLIFTRVVVRHWRPGVLPQLGRYRSLNGRSSVPDQVPPRKSPGRGYFLRLVYYALDFVVGDWLKDRVDASRQRLVCYDRCFLDMIVDPARYGLGSTRGMRLLRKFLRQPDLLVLLLDSPERINCRKPELSVSEIQANYARWQEWIDDGTVRYILPVKSGPADLARSLMSVVALEYLAYAVRRGWKVTHLPAPASSTPVLVPPSTSPSTAAT